MSRTLDLLADACARLPHTTRKMFGGHGFFAPNGGMFAGVVSKDEAILKLHDVAARTELEALGGHAWTYHGKHKPMVMREWIAVPESFYDDPDAFAAWAKRAHALAPAKQKAPPKSKTKPKPATKTPTGTPTPKKKPSSAKKKPARR
jgi:TfoX/Sxy family transcriptional regulator of competence genes